MVGVGQTLMASVPQRITVQALAQVAKVHGWDPAEPIGVVERVDPPGWDWLAQDPDWWAAIAIALRPYESWPGMAQIIRTAEVGAAGARKETAVDVVANTAKASAGDVADVAQDIRDKSSAWPWILGVGGLLWLASRR